MKLLAALILLLGIEAEAGVVAKWREPPRQDWTGTHWEWHAESFWVCWEESWWTPWGEQEMGCYVFQVTAEEWAEMNANPGDCEYEQ